ncbi:MAG: HEAT repeat domain-containing protein [Anaerolineae bacterium]
MTTPPPNLIAELLDFLNRPISNSNEADGEAAAVALGNLGDTGLPAISTLLASRNVDRRFWAVRSLWANGSPAAQEYLVGLLADSDELIRSAAALALGEMKAETAIPALAHIVTTDPTPVGRHAADALAKIGPPAAKTLIAALEHPESRVRVRAARALVPIESKAAIKPLIHCLDHDDSYLVRHYADEALKRMGVGQLVYFK